MTSPALLRERLAAERAAGRRIKDAADAIGVSEGELIAAHAGPHDLPLRATPLRGPWIELLRGLRPCGPLLALTRNASTVHEKTGIYEKLSANGHVGLALGAQIDLRLFFDRWHAGFAVEEAAAHPGRPPAMSLQFFDAHGQAVHKIHARESTDRSALRQVFQAFTAPPLGHLFRPAAAAEQLKPDEFLDTAALHADWRAMTDTHQFFRLLKKYGVERQQSFRLMEGRFAHRLAPGAVHELLQEAAFAGTSIMVFVGSPGCIQIHTGPIRRVEPTETASARWLNVLDADFNLHMREDRIATVWRVEKPTADGVVTSVEAFDHQGELMAMFFGARKPGQPECSQWRELAARLARPAAAPA